MQKSIKLFLLFCFISNSFLAAPVNAANKERIRYLLERARARKNQARGLKPRTQVIPSSSTAQSIETRTTETTTPVNEEGIGYLPGDTSRRKEVIYEKETTIVEERTVPKEKSYNDLVGQFNELFSETKTHVENKEAIVQEEHAKKAQEKATTTKKQPTPNYKPQIVTKKAKPEVHTKSTKRPEPVYIETKNETSQTLNQTETISNSTIKKIEKVESKIEAIEEKIEEESKPVSSSAVAEVIAKEEAKVETKVETVVEEKTTIAEATKEEVVVEETKEETPPSSVKTKEDKDKEHLQVIKNSLKSLEEDAWNEVKFNMGEALDYFDKERKKMANPSEIDRFYRITLAFLRFAEGGLELDQGDFADFEDAEAHYLDSQDILEAVEFKLRSQDPIDKELLKVIQTVKKYINEDIEYIEEMIDLS